MQQLHEVMPNASIGQGYGWLCSPFILLFSLNCLDIIGLTETCTSIAMMPPTKKLGTVGSAGQLLPGIIARVVKPDGTLASEGEQGELVVTGPSMSLGYYKNEAA
jgi:4-coumarate--CoA ligase